MISKPHKDLFYENSTKDIPKALSVFELNRLIEDTLESVFSYVIEVQGEISNFKKSASGHYYFSLKDKNSSISCALFRNKVFSLGNGILERINDGDKVIVSAKLSVYKPRGNYMLLVDNIKRSGEGDIAREFIELKKKLESMGLMDSERKRPIPSFPKKIALITSEKGAAIQDALVTIRKRAPFIDVCIYSTIVQGAAAAKKIISCIDNANDYLNPDTDIILLIRGGGSFEDLSSFNNEALALSVVNSRTPIITGVGHETDFTIVDFVSDYRAATPTAAAERATPDREELLKHIINKKKQLEKTINLILKNRSNKLFEMHSRLQRKTPERILVERVKRYDEIFFRLEKAIKNIVRLELSENLKRNRRLHLKKPIRLLEDKRIRISFLKENIKKSISYKLSILKNKYAEKKKDLNNNINDYINKKAYTTLNNDVKLSLLNPLSILNRGYAIVYNDNNEVISQSDNLVNKSKIRLQLKDGSSEIVISNIKKVENEFKNKKTSN